MHGSLLETKHLALAESVREAVKPLEDIHDDAALARAIAELGYYRYLVPAEHGGRQPGLDVRSLCTLREEIAYRSAAADSIFAVQGLGSHPVLLAGGEEQKRELLPRVAEGSVLF